jgi:hypothetical protein
MAAPALGLLMGASGLGARSAARSASRRGAASTGRAVGRDVAAGFRACALMLSLAVADVLALGRAARAGRRNTMMCRWHRQNTLIQAMVPTRCAARDVRSHSMMFMGMAPFGGRCSPDRSPSIERRARGDRRLRVPDGGGDLRGAPARPPRRSVSSSWRRGSQAANPRRR